MPHKLFDTAPLIGLRYGRLIIIEIMPYKIYKSNKNIVMVKCKCDCGNEKIIKYHSMKYNQTFSCGCFHIEMIRKSQTRHGLSYHPLYKVWASMKQRCENPNSEFFQNYGGRGISVCELWSKDFKSYHDWCIENGWKKGLEIDRINNDGNYEPSNCRAVKPVINARNKSSNHKITINGVTKVLSEWAELSGIRPQTLGRRVKDNWAEDRLLSPINESCIINKYRKEKQ